jgi:hypothetical protein
LHSHEKALFPPGPLDVCSVSTQGYAACRSDSPGTDEGAAGNLWLMSAEVFSSAASLPFPTLTTFLLYRKRRSKNAQEKSHIAQKLPEKMRDSFTSAILCAFPAG